MEMLACVSVSGQIKMSPLRSHILIGSLHPAAVAAAVATVVGTAGVGAFDTASASAFAEALASA